MSKLSREELWGIIQDWYRFTHFRVGSCDNPECRQAYEQIKSLLEENIESSPEESRTIHCPSCGRIWNLETHGACQCGATLKMPTKFEPEEVSEAEMGVELEERFTGSGLSKP